MHRFKTITSRDDVFTIAPVYVVPMDCEPSPHDVVPCLPAYTSRLDVYSASPSQPVEFGKSAARAELSVCGTMDSTSMSYQRTSVGALRGEAM